MPPLEFFSRRILVVDDEQSNLVLLERMLARAGYNNVVVCQDSRDVIRLVGELEPDLMLLDLMMPHVDGYQILEELSSSLPGDIYFPIVVLTADVTPQALQRTLSLGAKDFLTKPFDQTELLLRVRNQLQTRMLYLGMQRQLQQLEDFNLEARQAIVYRDEELSSISHDIGQPLAGMRFSIDLLHDMVGQLEESQRDQLSEAIDLIDAAALQMKAMLGEMSDLARLHMGRQLVLQRSDLDLVRLARTQVAAAKRSGSKVQISFASELPELVGRWDEVRLTRVLSNLLNNAVKFSPSGGKVLLEVARNDQEAVIEVRDQGVGIPQADLPHVFDAFFRASNVADRVAGTGVGLASARQIVEQHGGTISVASTEGAGTTVTLRLPLA